MTFPNDDNSLPPALQATAKAHWKALLIEGIVLALFGLAAIVLPPLVIGSIQITW
mgnify:CR=1 FL=1